MSRTALVLSVGALTMHSLQTGDGRTYVLLCKEEQRLTAVAAIEPANGPEAWAVLFRSLLKENGADYSVEFFGGLPSGTLNHHPDLIPADVVFQTYWDWMEWATNNFGADAWTNLRDEVIGELVEPDHLTRSLSALKGVPFGDLKRLQDYLEVREEEGSQLSRDDRLLILINYFGRAYKQKRRHPRGKGHS